MAKKFEIIKAFDVRKSLIPIPDLPIEKMDTNDAILLEDDAVDTLKNQQLWRQRVAALCVRKKLNKTDYKVSKQKDKLYVVRVYVTKIV